MLCMYILHKNHILFIPRQVFIWPKPHPPTLSLAASSWWEVSSSSEMRRWFCVTSCVFSSRRCVKQWRREGCYKGRKQTVKRRPFFMSNALEKQMWVTTACQKFPVMLAAHRSQTHAGESLAIWDYKQIQPTIANFHCDLIKGTNRFLCLWLVVSGTDQGCQRLPGTVKTRTAHKNTANSLALLSITQLTWHLTYSSAEGKFWATSLTWKHLHGRLVDGTSGVRKGL